MSVGTNALTYQVNPPSSNSLLSLTVKPKNDIAPAAFLAANATCFAVVGPGGSWFRLRDYLSVVFDEVSETQLSPSVPSTSNITVTIFDAEDEGGLEEDPDKTITPADFYRDEDTLSVCASPLLRE